MNTIDFNTYKFRASFLPHLMTNPTLADKKKGAVLSQTAKTALRELWIEMVYNRKKYDTYNKYTDKGTMCEPDAMDLLEKVTGKVHFKNNEEFSNEFITGTPDITIRDVEQVIRHIKDTKCSWDIWTYMAVTEALAKKSYYHQQLGYMWLTGARTADLDYCLVNTPELIMQNELYRMSFRYPELSGSDEEKIAPFKRSYIFDDIDPKQRVKTFQLEYNEEDVEDMKNRICSAREYMGGLSL